MGNHIDNFFGRNRYLRFGHELIRRIGRDSVLTFAGDMTYKILLALFPFALFLMSLSGFLKVDAAEYAAVLAEYVPEEARSVVSLISVETMTRGNAGILSGSLVAVVWSASRGFDALTKGISNAYGETRKRGFAAAKALNVGLVVLLAAVIICSVFVLIFGDSIYRFIAGNFGVGKAAEMVFGAVGYATIMAVMMFVVVMIYKFATVRKVTITEAFPGAAVTVGVWILASRGFNLYVNNFTRYSAVYGSVAGIVIFMLWINIISTVILIGAEINGLLMDYDKWIDEKAGEAEK